MEASLHRLSGSGLILAFFALVGLSFSSVDALNCYQCNSTTTAGCTEKFDYGSRVLQSASCQVSDAGYCVKAIGVWGAMAGTYRFCSSYDLGNQCQYVDFLDFDRPYRACVYTCSRDGCNGASGLSIPAATLFLPLLFTVVVALWQR